MLTINQILDSNTFQLLVGIILGGIVYTFGFHSGNRFRISRLNYRSPKEIQAKINELNHDLNIYENRITNETDKLIPDTFLLQEYEIKKARILAKRDVLFWVINKY